MKIGFIGTGNMASAILKGIIENDFIDAVDLYCYDISKDKLEELAAETGITPCDSNLELVNYVDVILLAVKPNMIEGILTELKTKITARDPLIVSIAAGTSIHKLETLLGPDSHVPIIRVMPNVNAMIGAGCAAVCKNTYASERQLQYIIEMFRSVGTALHLPEKDFSTFAAIAGSSPAYTYLYIDSLARAAVKNGMPKNLALKIAAQAVFGSAKMIMESNEHPWSLIDKVCSPGGTTAAGLFALEEEAFLATVVKGIDATIAREKEMLKK